MNIKLTLIQRIDKRLAMLYYNIGFLSKTMVGNKSSTPQTATDPASSRRRFCGSVYRRLISRNSNLFWRLDAVPHHTIDVDLFFGNTSAPYNSPFSVQIRDPVAGYISYS